MMEKKIEAQKDDQPEESKEAKEEHSLEEAKPVDKSD